MAPPLPPLRLLVVDDSAFNRRNIADLFAGNPDVEVVGKAADGEEALRLATVLKPDVITLDLEMPRMDGFTFLRILMSKQPTPVIVVSSYSQKENVFKALELGALDFVTKPDRQSEMTTSLNREAVPPSGSRGPSSAPPYSTSHAPERLASSDLREQIVSKVLLVRSLRPTAMVQPAVRRNMSVSGAFTVDGRPLLEGAPQPAVPPPPKHVIAIGSSTGGPSALLEIFGKIPATSTSGIVVAQHMPDKFTRTFAERLDRRGPVRCSEAQEGDRIGALTGFVCPGRQCMEVFARDGELRIKVVPANSGDRYVPSADRLLKSVAASAGARSVGVILTGMGDDGVEGARAIREAGGTVLAEAQETAVVFGMPGAAVRAGVVTKVLPLPAIAEYLAQLV